MLPIQKKQKQFSIFKISKAFFQIFSKITDRLPAESPEGKRMPIDIVFVRHGESEGNRILTQANQGDNTNFTPDFRKRPSSMWRLTNLGQEQARIAGEWVRKNIGEKFDRYYTSEYLRAMETAALLNLKEAKWIIATYLRERDWGVFELLSPQERMKKFKREMERHERDSYYFAPPGGESLAQVCIRVDRILSTLREQCCEQSVILVTHREILTTFRVRLERIPQVRFKKLLVDPDSSIRNGQILHYSRRDPKTGKISPYLRWKRSVCPWDLKNSNLEWEEYERSVYSNDELLDQVEKTPKLLHEKKAEVKQQIEKEIEKETEKRKEEKC